MELIAVDTNRGASAVFIDSGNIAPVIRLNSLAARLFNLVTGAILPESIKTADAPLFVSTAISSIAFFLLLYFFYQRQQRERTLADALYAMLYSGEGEEMPDGEESNQDGQLPNDTPEPPFPPESITERRLRKTDLTEGESKVAMLLLEGKTRSEILRNLHISASELGQQEKAIRNKLLNPASPDETVATIVALYGLTKRESDMLQYLRQSKSNKEISSELFISEETIRIHIRNLLKKLPVENRNDIAAWVESFGPSPDK